MAEPNPLPNPLPNPRPIDLPRLLMRRASLVAAGVLLLALVLGLQRMQTDIDDEFDAAHTLAQLIARLGQLGSLPDAPALAALQTLAAAHPPRHLLLQVQAADGRLLLAPPALPPSPAPLRWLLVLHRSLLAPAETRAVAWPLDRPDGGRWWVTLTASHESERREAMANLLGTLALLLACIGGLLLAMRWNLRRALAPLGRLLVAISGIEGHNTRAVQALPTMPIRELEALAVALRHLAGALDQAEDRRRLLSQQLLTLQEDERAHLARELHDEFGQRLTALRVDAAWLARRLAGQPEAASVIAGMAGQCQQIQHDIRSLLTRLLPFGPAQAAAGGEQGQTLGRLGALLQALVAGWAPAAVQADANLDSAIGPDSTRYQLELQALDAPGQAQPWPSAEAAEALRLPQALALTLYRISQEALTNVARHAQARQARLRLVCQGRLRPGEVVQIRWSVSDDGIGLPSVAAAQQRGNGISGLRERVWAQGGALVLAARPGGSGLALEVCFDARWLGPEPAAAAVPGDPAAAWLPSPMRQSAGPP